MTEVVLRPAAEADDAFLRAVYASTRADELARTPWTDEQKAAFLAMQYEAQWTHYESTYPNAALDVVVVDGEDAGRLWVQRVAEEIRVIDIALLPAFRGRGVGSGLLGDILAEGRETGRTVTIYVEHQNPARHLYDRLGFVEIEDVGVYFKMEWTP